MLLLQADCQKPGSAPCPTLIIEYGTTLLYATTNANQFAFCYSNVLQNETYNWLACICIFRNFIWMIQSNPGFVFSNNLIGLKTKYIKRNEMVKHLNACYSVKQHTRQIWESETHF